MSFLIDTDTCSAHLRGNGRVSGRFLQYTGRLNLSTITRGELLCWTLRRKSPAKYREGLQKVFLDVSLLPFDHVVADRFGEVRAGLLDTGTPIAPFDVMIAATALVHGLVVVTHNRKHFDPIPGVVVEDWLSDS
jgi:tRNA(fMet)-specific endonuclease VapC